MILQILSLDRRLKPWLAFLNLVSFELSPPPFRDMNLAKLGCAVDNQHEEFKI